MYSRIFRYIFWEIYLDIFGQEIQFSISNLNLIVLIAGLIIFDHPVIIQASGEQFFNPNLLNLIDISFAQIKFHFISELLFSLQYGLIKTFIIYFS